MLPEGTAKACGVGSLRGAHSGSAAAGKEQLTFEWKGCDLVTDRS